MPSSLYPELLLESIFFVSKRVLTSFRLERSKIRTEKDAVSAERHFFFPIPISYREAFFFSSADHVSMADVLRCCVEVSID